MKNRWKIDKDNLILYIVVILLAVLTIWGLLYKIKEGMMIILLYASGTRR